MATILWKIFVSLLCLVKRIGSAGKSSPQQVASVLIVELTRLGDVIVMIPALRLLRDFFPHADVYVFVEKAYAPLLEALNLRITVYGIDRSATVWGLLRGIGLARSLRSTVAISMSPTKRNALLCVFAGAKNSVGYLAFADPYSQYTYPVPVTSLGRRAPSGMTFGREHISERALRICQAVGMPTLKMPEGESVEHSFFLARRRSLADGVIPSNKYVVLHPFSGWTYRNWDLERFHRLAEFVVNELSHDVVFVCAEAEAVLLKDSQKRFSNNPAVHFFSSASVLDTAVVLEYSSLFIGNDSGPLHLAALVGVPSVGLFGPAPPELTAPQSHENVYLYKHVECSPCDQRLCVRPHDSCMRLITSDEVESEVSRLISRGSTDRTVHHG
jgi:ADP-heptose:LPS heptosyltransferase